MRVLDVGSGVGDVALLVADLVGPTGMVVGIDWHLGSPAVRGRAWMDVVARLLGFGHEAQHKPQDRRIFKDQMNAGGRGEWP
jgi:tRNA A58 N-methylase Trm61